MTDELKAAVEWVRDYAENATMPPDRRLYLTLVLDALEEVQDKLNEVECNSEYCGLDGRCHNCEVRNR